MNDKSIKICLWIGMFSSIGTIILLGLYYTNLLKENLNNLILYSYLISILPSSILLRLINNKLTKPIENIKIEAQEEVEIPLEKDKN